MTFTLDRSVAEALKEHPEGVRSKVANELIKKGLNNQMSTGWLTDLLNGNTAGLQNLYFSLALGKALRPDSEEIRKRSLLFKFEAQKATWELIHREGPLTILGSRLENSGADIALTIVEPQPWHKSWQKAGYRSLSPDNQLLEPIVVELLRQKKITLKSDWIEWVTERDRITESRKAALIEHIKESGVLDGPEENADKVDQMITLIEQWAETHPLSQQG